MALSVLSGDLQINGNLYATGFTPPAASVADATISATAGIQATKVIHAFPIRHMTVAGTAVANAVQPMHIVGAAAGATVYAFKCTLLVVPTSSDTIVVDLKRSTGGGSFATILSSPITFNSSSTALTVVSAGLSTTALNQNDLLELAITGTNSTGQGLLAVISLREGAA